MSIMVPYLSGSVEVAVGASTGQFSVSMADPQIWMFVANVDAWIAQGANPTASAGAGSMFVPARTPVYILGSAGAKLAVIEDSSGGKASLTEVRYAG